MIMGAAIASADWIAIYPWGKLRRLREFESRNGDDRRPRG